MSYYLLLSVSTFLITVLGVFIWKRTNSIGFMLGIALLYYFSLYGGWFLVHDARSGISDVGYFYLFEKMFFVRLDDYYFEALLYYTLFIIGVELTLIYRISSTGAKPNVLPMTVFSICRNRLIVAITVAMFASYWFHKDYIVEAFKFDISGYYATRHYHAYFTLHQLANRLALYSVVLSFVAFLCGNKGKLIVSKKDLLYGLLNFILLCVVVSYIVFLGNKNELLSSALAGLLLFFANSPKFNLRRLFLVGVSSLAFISIVDGVRGLPPSDYLAYLTDPRFLWDASTGFLRSNESFAAHFSMYGVLSMGVPLTYGSSLLNFPMSFVPRLLWPDRPLTVYEHYATSVSVVEGQGYTIHHATGWFLNFGIVGILLGAILLGTIWSKLYSWHCVGLNSTSRLKRIFSRIGTSFFIGGLPALIRGGPEAYKAMFIECMILPAIVMALCTKEIRNPMLPSAIKGKVDHPNG